MGSMNISIKQEAYDLLCSLKGNDKSFSEVVIELVNEKKKKDKNIMKFAGVLREKGEEYWRNREEEYRKIRKDIDSEVSLRGSR
jgi:predicted CopG family antitoxin